VVGTFSKAELVSGGVIESLIGEGEREGVGRYSGVRSGDEVRERIEGGGMGVGALGPLKKSAV
jgi:hypothetical protein